MSLFRKKQKLELYSEEDINRLEAHIAENFGEFSLVLHEIESTDIHLDIAVVPPVSGREYMTLITMGMGAHRMNVPTKLRNYRMERAEIAVCLPPDWKLDSPDERDYWPIRLLKDLARLPIANDTWLGWGHSMSGQGSYADNTSLSAVLLDAFKGDQGYQGMSLSNGDIVRFWQMIPLYNEELSYKQEHGADALLELFEAADDSRVINIARRNYCIQEEHSEG